MRVALGKAVKSLWTSSIPVLPCHGGLCVATGVCVCVAIPHKDIVLEYSSKMEAP